MIHLIAESTHICFSHYRSFALVVSPIQAQIKVFVQAKRYKFGSKVNAGVVKRLRQAILFGGQGAFITTAEYQTAAADVALEEGFPRIGFINGRQLVDLLIEHWGDIPPEFQERLGLKPGLVRI